MTEEFKLKLLYFAIATLVGWNFATTLNNYTEIQLNSERINHAVTSLGALVRNEN